MRDALIAALLLAAAPAAAAASAPPPAEVTVSVGAGLQDKAEIYGAREFPELAEDLRRAVAARAAKGGFSRLELVLENVVPNRPTATMLGQTTRFAPDSLSRGGAAVSGVAYGAAGAQPIRFSWWAYDLSESAGSAIWTDAERAFQLLGSELAHGRAPADRSRGDVPATWPRSGSRVDNPGLQR